MRARFKFEPRDLWVGLFWRKTVGLASDRRWFRRLELFLCFVPCFPLVLTFDEQLLIPTGGKKERP